MKNLSERTVRTSCRIAKVLPLAILLGATATIREAAAGDGVVFAGTETGRIHQIDLAYGVIVWTSQMSTDDEEPIRCLEASEDGAYLAVGGATGVALFTADGTELEMFPPGIPLEVGTDGSGLVEQTQVAIDATGESFAAAMNDGTMRIYERVGNIVVEVWISAPFNARSVALNEDGSTIVGVGEYIQVARKGPDGIWLTADDQYYTHTDPGWSGEFLNVDVSWDSTANPDPYVVVGGRSNGMTMSLVAGYTHATTQWIDQNDRGDIMSVAVSEDGAYMASGNDDPGDSNGSQLDLFDGATGAVYWTHVPGNNGGNDLRSLDLQTTAAGEPYFASGGSGECTVFVHDVYSSTPSWSGNSVGERDRVSLLRTDWVVTCDLGHPRVVIYDTSAGSVALHKVITDGDCLTVDAANRSLSRPGYQYCPGDGSGGQCLYGYNSGRMAGCLWDSSGYYDGGVLAAFGTNSHTTVDVYLLASDVENNWGIFFGGTNAVSNGAGVPFGCGLRCAGGAVVRLSPPALAHNNRSSCGPIENKDDGIVAGETRYYQYWFRSPSCPFMFNLTNGYAITWQ